MFDPLSEIPLHMKMDASWIKPFPARLRILNCAHTEKHRSSPEKEEQIEISIAAHLSTLCGLFQNVLGEAGICNAKMAFVMRMRLTICSI